jgi:hypothetical protein
MIRENPRLGALTFWSQDDCQPECRSVRAVVLPDQKG